MNKQTIISLNRNITALKQQGHNGPTTYRSAEETPGCLSAISPLAYLADLLDYATRHILKQGTPISLEEIEAYFHQPFGRIPLNCEALQEEVPQIRICVEVLRQHFKEGDDYGLPGSMEKQYREDTYAELLLKLGTSYSDIEKIADADADADTLAGIAKELGIDESHLHKLWPGKDKLSEAWLSQTFGLSETTDVQFDNPTPQFLVWREEYLEKTATALFGSGKDHEAEKEQWLLEKKQAAANQLKQRIFETEELILPDLREAYLPSIASARQAGRALLINCEYDPCFRTTRVSQAITTMQQLITSIRSGLLQSTHPEWTFDAEAFAEEWKWLGNYQSWRSAMMVFLFPENVLNPLLKEDHSGAMQQIAYKLRKARRLTRAQVDKIIGEYETYLEDVSNLAVEVSCYSHYTDTPESEVFFQFARNKGRGYMATFENNLQSDWVQLPEINITKPMDSSGRVYVNDSIYSLVAALPFTTSNRERLLCLYIEYHNTLRTTGVNYGNTLYLLRYSLDNRKWINEPVELLSKSGHLGKGVVLKGSPEIDSHFIYYKKYRHLVFNQLNLSATGLRFEDWTSSRTLIHEYSLTGVGAYLDNKHFLFVNKSVENKTFIWQVTRTNDNELGIAFADVQFNNHVTIGAVFGKKEDSHTLFWIIKSEKDYIRAIEFKNGKIGTSRPLGSSIKSFSNHFGNSQVNTKDGFRICFTDTTGGQTRQKHAFLEEKPASFGFTDMISTTLKINTYQLKPGSLKNRREVVSAAFQDNKGMQKVFIKTLWEAFYFLPMLAGLQLQKKRYFADAKDYFRLVYDYTLTNNERKIFYGLQQEESTTDDFQRIDQWLLDPLTPHAVASTRKNAYTEYTVLAIVRCLLQEADAAFTTDTPSGIAKARSLYATVVDLLTPTEANEPTTDKATQSSDKRKSVVLADLLMKKGEVPASSFTLFENSLLNIDAFTFSIPQNPVWQLLQFHAEANLFKINSCRNIAGDQRPTSTLSINPPDLETLINAGDNLIDPNPASGAFQPTPYRFAVLIERAKQITGLAQQIETAFLSTLEKLDAEQLNVINAQNDIQLSKAGIRLQDLRLAEANKNRALVELQTSRSELVEGHYNRLLSAGVTFSEQLMLKSQLVAMTLSVAKVGSELVKSGLTFGIGGDPIGAAISAAHATASFAQTKSTFYRRRQDWSFQRRLAGQDIRIGQQQGRIAQDQIKIATQERNIATLRADQAETIAQFLTNKFTNAELYDWMSEILEDVYSFFLQQATATAQLAAQQLAFERQEPVPAIILSDYWEAPKEEFSSNGSSETPPDRRGLTGSARLLRDIYQLDQHALQTDRRKLQMSKTISLASLSPAEFQQFRETGNLFFHTPMELFDRDFPGHYLRLIKRVRVSVIALAPTIDGIKATLSSGGSSRTVQFINGLSFKTTEIKRLSESVALTAAINATGVFDFEAADQTKLRPFESMGVDAIWQFELPKAANLSLNYDSIADVLITIDYTALHSEIHKMEVIERLDKTLVADRAFSFRNDFPDQWYDLHHPEDLPAEQQLTAHFDLLRDDFPPNIQNLRVKHITLYLPQEDYPSLAVTLNREGKSYPYQNRMTPEGIASSRDADNHQERWQKMLGKSPVGLWTLGFPVNDTVKQWFKGGRFQDIILVITYEGDIQY